MSGSPAKLAEIPELMPEKTVDPRIVRTRKLLQQALVNLMKEKEFDCISVQDIAEDRHHQSRHLLRPLPRQVRPARVHRRHPLQRTAGRTWDHLQLHLLLRTQSHGPRGLRLHRQLSAALLREGRPNGASHGVGHHRRRSAHASRRPGKAPFNPTNLPPDDRHDRELGDLRRSKRMGPDAQPASITRRRRHHRNAGIAAAQPGRNRPSPNPSLMLLAATLCRH